MFSFLKKLEKKDPNKIISYAFIVYILLGIWAVLHHEPWRDEFHSAMIAEKSTSLADLFARKKYEGHPVLWYILLYYFQFFSQNLMHILWLNFTIASVAVWLVLRYAPFGIWERVAIVFGYFFVFEYAILARNYAIELLFLFGFCTLFAQREKPRIQAILGILLFLLMQTNIFGVLFGGILAVFLAYDLLLPLILQKDFKAILPIFVRAGLPVLLGIGVALWAIVPPSDGDVNRDYTGLMSAFRALGTVWGAYFPIPDFSSPHFWNSNIINWGGAFNGHYKSLFSVIILVILTRILRPNKPALWLFWSGTLLVLIFTMSRYPGWLRHHGHLYLWFVASFWIKNILDKNTNFMPPPSVSLRLTPKIRAYFFPILLGAQVFVGIWAIVSDTFLQFSNGGEVAEYLRENGHRYNRIVVHHDYTSESYAGILHRNFYHATIRDTAYYVVFSRRREKDLEPRDVVRNAQKDFNTDSTLFIFSADLRDSTHIPVQEVKRFGKAIVEDESYYLYQIRKQ